MQEGAWVAHPLGTLKRAADLDFFPDAGLGDVAGRVEPDGSGVQFQADVEGTWSGGVYGLLSCPEGGSGDKDVIVSGERCCFW